MNDKIKKTEDQTWKRMQFKQNKVWMAVTPDETPIVKNGKVLIKYQTNQDYEYWVHENNITPLSDKQNQDLVEKQTPRKSTKPKKIKTDSHVLVSDETEIDPKDLTNTLCIYTDGASSGNPGPAGIGVVLQYGEHEKEISQFIGNATNNIAELQAIKTGLKEIKNPKLPIRLFTDSSYALGVLTKGWKPKKNQDLIQSIITLLKKFKDIQFIKVKGHAGHPENERADHLATSAIKKAGDG